MPFKHWIRPLTLAALLLCFTVVVLGAYVRLTAAGLGCPDWPGCYGHVTPLGAQHSAAAQAAFPQRPLEVGKAWREMIHRYAAATLGLIIVAHRALSPSRAGASAASALVWPVRWWLLVMFQGMLGMLTVTWLLKPLIVTGHLVGGLTTLALLWWLWLSMRTARGCPSGCMPTGKPGRTAAARAGVDTGSRRAGRARRAGLRSAAGPAATTPPSPVRTCRPARTLVAAGGLPGCLRAVARSRHQLRRRRAGPSGARRDPFHASRWRAGGRPSLLARRFTRVARARPAVPRGAAVAVLAALALQLSIGIIMVEKGIPAAARHRPQRRGCAAAAG